MTPTLTRLGLAAALALATTAAQADIAPQSGLWKGDLYVTGERGCPSEIRAGLSDVFAQNGYQNERLTFPDPFDPAGTMGDFKWQKTGADTWAASGKDTQRTPVGKVTLEFSHRLTVLSETQMDQRSTVAMTLPKKLAKMLGVGGPCVVESRVDHSRVGD